MRARIMGLLLVAAATLGAQSPMAPAKVKGPTKAEFRIGGFMLQGERNYEFSTVQKATGQSKGVEVLMRAPGIGIYVRSLSGEYGGGSGGPKIISADARLLLFPPAFTIFGGVGKRAIVGDLGTNLRDVFLGGVSMTWSIGGTGLRTHISGAMLVSPDKSGTGGTTLKNPGTGIDGEASIYYRLPGVPFFVTAGYRKETFNAKAGGISAPEETGALRFGGGIQFGGR